VSTPCTVLIAPPDHLSTLKEIADAGDGEVLAFVDADALRALEAITRRRPAVVTLERQFASTPRGTALINRIKADPALANSEIRVVSPDGNYARVSARRSAGDGVEGGSAGATAAAVAPAVVAPALDQRGTRRAQRFKIKGPDVLIDGNQASLVDLSTVGAQVLSTTVLKPNQRVRVSLADDQGVARFNASVAWASFEIPPRGDPRYRAGIDFIDAHGAAVDAYCDRHKVQK
jgi:hypothetical protein